MPLAYDCLLCFLMDSHSKLWNNSTNGNIENRPTTKHWFKEQKLLKNNIIHEM